MVQFADNLERAIREAIREERQPFWRPRIVHLRADITELDDATIYFGLLKSNPLINYQLLLAQSCPVLDAWLAPFGALRIDQIFFVYAWSSVSHASYKVTQLAGLSLGIATPGEDYKRWLTTFPILRQGQLVAWCVEIDMRNEGGEMGVREIALSDGNMQRLEEG